jgi:hypothetical protein
MNGSESAMATEKAIPAEWMQRAALEIEDGLYEWIGWDGYEKEGDTLIGKIAQIIAAHSPSSENREPDGYAYRYPDGIRYGTHGKEINGCVPSEAIPFYFAQGMTLKENVEAACPRCGSHNRDFFIGHARIDKKEDSCYPEDHDPWHD